MDAQERHEKYFCTKQLSNDLAGRSVRGGLAALGSQWTRLVVQLIGTMVLARLLVPDDFGLIAMVTVVTGFAAMFKDAGLSMATIQQKDISHEQVSSLFWFNVALSLALGGSLVVSAPLVATFFNRSELVYITIVLGASFLASGLTIQHQALLRRKMRFGALAVIGIFSRTAEASVGIMLAYWGYGYWSLVMMSVTGACCTLFGTIVACPWIPGLPFKGAGVKKLLTFGGHLTGFSFVDYFARNTDNILIGHLLGANALALYSKAYQIVYLPLINIRWPINNIAIPALSSLQDDPERFRRYYGKIAFAMALFSMPLMAFCAVFPQELVLLFFGPQWLAMTEMFRLLAILGFIQPVMDTSGTLLIACGKSKIYLWLGVGNAIVMVIGFCIGVNWGATGVAASCAIVSWVMRPSIFLITTRYVPVSFRELLENCLAIAMFSGFAALVAKYIVYLLPNTAIASIVIGGLAMVIFFSGGMLLHSASRMKLWENSLILRKSLLR